MATAQEPLVLLNGVCLNDDVRYALDPSSYESLMAETTRRPAMVRPTFGRNNRVLPQVDAYMDRQIRLLAEILRCQDWLTKQKLRGALVAACSTLPARLQIGSLACEPHLTGVAIPDRQDAHLPDRGSFELRGEASPGTWRRLYNQCAGDPTPGAIPGFVVRDDRPDHASLKGTGNPISITNPGSAVTYLVARITNSSYASTAVYIRSTHQDSDSRIVVTLDANGNADIEEAHGLVLPPGAQSIQFEDVGGTLLSSPTWAMAWNETEWLFLGNDGGHMAECPATFEVQRTGSATYVNSAGALAIAGDSEPRIGVPYGTYDASKAGLICEGSTTNLLTSNQATATDTDTLGNTTGFGTDDGILTYGGSTLTSDGTQYRQGSKSLKAVTTGATDRQGWNASITASANTKHTSSCWVKGTAGVVLQLQMRDATNGVNSTLTQITLTGGWDYVSNTITTGALAVTSLLTALCTVSAVATTFYTDTIQVETGPFPTSWVDGTRNADSCATVIRASLLKYSHRLASAASTVQSPWAVTGWSIPASPFVAASDGTLTATRVTVTNVSTDNVRQALTPPSNIPVGGQTFTIAAKLRQGATTASCTLDIENQSGTSRGTLAITLPAPSASYQTFYKTVTMNSADTGIIPKLRGANAAGSIDVEYLKVIPGSFAGLPVRTTDTPVLPDDADLAAPDGWDQNGWIEFDFCWPQALSATAQPEGKDIGFFGNNDGSLYSGFGGATLCLWRYGGVGTSDKTFQLQRRHNGSTGYYTAGSGAANATTVNIFDGTVHRLRLQWGNDVEDGVRKMPMRIYQKAADGSLTELGSADVAPLYGATAWVAPDRIWLSAGANYGVISNVTIGFPTLPAGAVVDAG